MAAGQRLVEGIGFRDMQGEPTIGPDDICVLHATAGIVLHLPAERAVGGRQRLELFAEVPGPAAGRSEFDIRRSRAGSCAS